MPEWFSICLICLSVLEKFNFLGISIVGQSNDRGDGGIYIGSIMKGGAVAADGRIEPGDMLLQVLIPPLHTYYCLYAPVTATTNTADRPVTAVLIQL